MGHVKVLAVQKTAASFRISIWRKRVKPLSKSFSGKERI